MEVVEKRKVKELLTLYSLHPERKDIFVEGITDKLVIERFLEKNKTTDFRVIEIDTLDFSDLYTSFPELKRNMKQKILRLSIELEKAFTPPLKSITCIADKDFDAFLNQLIKNNYLLYTDFTSLEMYLFNADCIRIFYKNILRNFPFTPSQTLKELSRVLQEKYFIRLAIQIKNQINDEKLVTDIIKSVVIDKTSGSMKFESKVHLQKILHNGKIDKFLNEYIECITGEKKKCSADSRDYIRGHDFIHLFFIYINKIKNHISLSEDTLERSLYQSIDYSKLIEYPLFETLKKKYA